MGKSKSQFDFKSRLNHVWFFDLTTRIFDLKARDFIWILFEFFNDLICDLNKLQISVNYL